MNSANTNHLHRNAAWQRLPVEWWECPGELSVPFRAQRKILRQNGHIRACLPRPLRQRGLCGFQSQRSRSSFRAFTILELLLVVGIIGLMAAMALPHLGGLTKGNAITAATRQLLDDVALARQRALVNRSEVCMVFLPASFWTNDTTNIYASGAPGGFWTNQQVANLFAHQYSAYALIALRSVGDQPGRSNVHYLLNGTWKTLPQGIYISPFQFTNAQGPGSTNWITTTNTTSGLTNIWPVTPFPTNILFPFPSTFTANSNILPYICFTPSGRLSTNTDQFISLTSGSALFLTNTDGTPQPVNLVETPPGNASNNAYLIHIDWLTARAKIERNQF